MAVVCLLAVQVGSARAETPAGSEDQADLWLNATLQQQFTQDIFGRYAAAPSSVVLGGFALVGSLLLDLPAGATAAYMASGALLLTAAIGLWANSDPYAAQRWYAATASLGFVALGTGLALQCIDPDACGVSSSQVVIAASSAGFFLSLFILSLIDPPPSPGALELAVRGRGPAERRALVLDFLERRDRSRRRGAYVSLGWGFAMGAGVMASAHDAATSDGRAFLYGAGGVLIGLTAAGLLYELLRHTDAERFRAGEPP